MKKIDVFQLTIGILIIIAGILLLTRCSSNPAIDPANTCPSISIMQVNGSDTSYWDIDVDTKEIMGAVYCQWNGPCSWHWYKRYAGIYAIYGDTIVFHTEQYDLTKCVNGKPAVWDSNTTDFSQQVGDVSHSDRYIISYWREDSIYFKALDSTYNDFTGIKSVHGSLKNFNHPTYSELN